MTLRACLPFLDFEWLPFRKARKRHTYARFGAGRSDAHAGADK